MHTSTKKWIGFSLAILAAVLWGVSGTFGQFLFERRAINTEWLIAVRLSLSGILLLGFSAAQNKGKIFKVWKNKHDRSQLILFGIFGMLAVQYTFFITIKHSNAATATVLQYIGPVFIAMYLAFKSKRAPLPKECVAIALAVIGTFLLVTHGNFGVLSISTAALIWGLASAVALAFYSLHPIALLNKHSASIVIGWAMLIGGAVLSCVHAPWKVEGIWNWQTYLFTFIVIVPGSLMAFYMYLSAVRMIGAQKTSLLATAEPLSAAIIAMLWLNVQFGVMDWLGTFCILSAMFLLAKEKPEEKLLKQVTKELKAIS